MIATSYRFTKADRLIHHAEFTALTRIGKKIQNENFIAYVSEVQTGCHRIGVTVTKRVGHAAARNRLKRLVREYFRQNRHKLTGFYEINLIAKKPAVTMTNNAILISLENLFERIAATHRR